jgi:hypothetical protein
LYLNLSQRERPPASYRTIFAGRPGPPRRKRRPSHPTAAGRRRRPLHPTRSRQPLHPKQSRQPLRSKRRRRPPRPRRSPRHQHPLRTRHWTWNGRSSTRWTLPSPGWVARLPARQPDRPPPSPPHRPERPHPDHPPPNQPRRSFTTGWGGKRRRQTATSASTRKRSDFRVQSRCAGGAASPGTPAVRAGRRLFSYAPGAGPSS